MYNILICKNNNKKKEKKQMKKVKVGIILLLAILLISINCYATVPNWKIAISTEKQEIAKTQELVKIDITLEDYEGDGILGYEGKLEYDKNIFETVTITALNDWDAINYDKTTNKFMSTTTVAKKGTKIAQITLKLKSNITAKTTEVAVKNLAFSDGDNDKTEEKIITYHFPYNEEETTPDKIPDTNDKTEPEKKPDVSGTDTTTGTKQPNTQTTNKETTEDKTKAQTRIPQTGTTPIGIITVIAIVICGIIGYKKYHSIPLK